MSMELISIVKNATIALPASGILLLVLALSVCLVMRMPRVGLVVAYLFVYRWGSMFFVKQTEGLFTAYLVFGVVVGVLAVIGMLQSEASS